MQISCAFLTHKLSLMSRLQHAVTAVILRCFVILAVGQHCLPETNVSINEGHLVAETSNAHPKICSSCCFPDTAFA